MKRLALIAMTILVGCKGPISPVGWRPDDRLVYQPSRFPEGDWQPADLTIEEATFASVDGTRLHGWYCPCAKPRAVVLVCHGNAGNVTHRAALMRILQQRLGVSAMIFDYRGYGRSDGAPSESGLLDDARAAREWLARRTGLMQQDIVLLGESLGGGVAIDLAAAVGCRGLILHSTFTSLPDVARHLIPYAPVQLVMANRFDSLAKIERYRGPAIIFHGDADTLIPLSHAQRLQKATGDRAQLVVMPGEGHNWLPGESYVRHVDLFFDKLTMTEAAARRLGRFTTEQLDE